MIAHLYEERGWDFPLALRGMFAAAVWDRETGTLTLARDRLGIKPLYYAVAGDRLVFASELKSLLASGLVPLDLDYEAIDAYLALGFIPGPRTPLAAVSRLAPGTMLVVEDGRVEERTWWRYPEPPARPARLSVEEAAEGLMAHMEESVRLRLMSDVPLGAMLSGGLDSSFIVGLMARLQAAPVKTFSVGLAGAAADNELSDAALVARHFGTEHHELELELDGEAVDLAELVWHMDEPLADLSGVGLALRHDAVAMARLDECELLHQHRGLWELMQARAGIRAMEA